ncbi:hypothetical protein OIU76_019893 [Salix suchowensis]|uniref:UBL3-like ubiquitin domain-containing protein n=1 Tax=Salix suchowensis TaxID=1278906 RepID=A0ABQ8ZKP9_9ROSI|nr:hypothetical protein OIU76_019893 [Salix suchowensis]KAJ6302272.1 hypothetical protein OIU77_016373 [Salix suchowensis]
MPTVNIEDKKIAPKAANDVKLINAGKILENNKTVGQCRVPFGDLPKGVITMHVVVQPSLAKAKAEKKLVNTNKELDAHFLYSSGTSDSEVLPKLTSRSFAGQGG